MEEGFILMNLSKYKRWRAILQRVIVEQQSKRELTHLVCLLAVGKYKKVERLIDRMIMKQQVKNERIERKHTCCLCFVNGFKFQENKFKNLKRVFRK